MPDSFAFVAPINTAPLNRQEQSDGTEATAPQSHKSYGTMAYTDQMVIDAWKQFIVQNPTQDTRLASLFATLKPQRVDDTDKWAVYLYPHQKPIVEGKMALINDFVRRSVSNDNVDISLVVAQQENETGYRPYLPQDKLQKMVTDNPNLVTLINNFNLKLA